MNSLQSASLLFYAASILILLCYVYYKDNPLPIRKPFIVLGITNISGIIAFLLWGEKSINFYKLALILGVVSQLTLLEIIDQFLSNPLKKTDKTIIYLLAIFSSSFIFSYLTTNSVFKIEFSYITKFTPEFFSFFLMTNGLSVLSYYLISSTKKAQSSLEALKTSYLKIALLIGSLPIILLNLIAIPLEFSHSYLLIQFILGGIFLFISSASIFRSKLFDLEKLMPELAKALTLAMIPLLLFYLITYLDQTIFDNNTPNEIIIINLVILTAIVLIVTQLLKDQKVFNLPRNLNFIQLSVQKDNFLEDIKEELRLNKLVEILDQALAVEIKPTSVQVVICNTTKHEILYTTIKTKKIEEALINTSWYIKQLDYYDTILVDETLKGKLIDKYQNFTQIYELINTLKAEVLVPYQINDDFNGLIFLGPKQNNKAYTVQDFAFISSLTSNLSLASGRAILYEEVDSFNKTLQKEVEEATIDMQENFDKLQAAYKKEKDMIDILSHELRTPLSIARNAVMVIQSAKTKRKLTQGKLDNYIGKAVLHLQKEISLLERMLSSSKIDNNEVIISPQTIDLQEIVTSSVNLYQKEAVSKGLELKSQINQKLEINADPKHLREIITNLIDNAIKYTDKGSINIKAKKLSKVVKLEISDTGKGISKKDISHIGKKFYRGNNYIEESSDASKLNIVRPGGTGLGLYVAYGLIKAMNWDIKVNSKLGQGTTFIISIPLS